MSNIAIIGYNIFGIGGTTRSNLNLMHEFGHSDYQLHTITTRSLANVMFCRLRISTLIPPRWTFVFSWSYIT